MSTNCNCSKCNKSQNSQENKKSSCTDDNCVACHKSIYQESRYWCRYCDKYHQTKNTGWAVKKHYTNNIYSKRNPILKNNQRLKDPKKSHHRSRGSKLKHTTKTKSKKERKPNDSEVKTVTNQVGPAGPKGPIGLMGPKGEAGQNGLAGPIGPQGLIGPVGKNGSKGDNGTRGVQGPPGKDGINGQNITSGIKGDIGPQGIRGIQGPPGMDGHKGDIGMRGILGIKGDIGPRGLPGINGQKGNIGLQGLPGKDGQKGDIGSQGIQGPPGKDGQKGDIGSQGIQGTPGKDGQEGDIPLEGIQGPPGQDGLDGQKGDIGPQGIQGIPGKDGLDGQKSNSGSKVFEEQKDSCCPIITEFGVGSGFFIRKDGYICTCAHVVMENGGSTPNANRASIVIVDLTNANGVIGKNIQVRCDIVGIDQAADIAVLKVRTTSQDSIFGFNLANQSSIVWGDSTNTLEGSHCHVIGQPEGIDRRSISSGTLRDNKFIATSNPLAPEGIFFNAPIHPGNSGSPVFDSTGKVIGMACYSYTSLTGGGGRISLEDMAGGTCQYIAQHVTDSIISTGSDYDGNKKGYLGLESWAPCIGVELYNLRINNPAFSLIGETNGLVVKSLDITGGTSGRRAHQATIPILVNDVLLEIQVKNQNNTKIKLGVYDDQYHIGRMTWLHPPGTILTLTVVRPSTGQTFATDLTLDVYPDQKDVVFSSSNFKSIDTLQGKTKLSSSS